MTDLNRLPLTSSHWGTYRAKVKNGRVDELLDFEEDGESSPIGQGIINVQDGPTRIASPMVRKSWLENGPGSRNELRGVEPFVQVSWAKAEKLVADELEIGRTSFHSLCEARAPCYWE